MSENIFWDIHRDLMVKSIEELSFEEILRPTNRDQDFYELILDKEITYRFMARIGIWDNIQVESISLRKFQGEKEIINFSALTFFQEIQNICVMSDITLSTFLEEANQTIYAEKIRREKVKNLSLETISTYPYEEIDPLLSGHPKILLDKGRLGFSAEDLDKYSPESKKIFSLVWVAVKKDKVISALASDFSWTQILRESLSENDLKKYEQENYLILPVHPWQWDQYIKIQYQEMIMKAELVYLGILGDNYTPQISLRTLSNSTRKNKADIKLSLSILNTSSFRGIPSRYIEKGPRISEALFDLVHSDQFLREKNFKVVKELGAISMPLPSHQKIQGSPYRYLELLGAIWRENTSSLLATSEQAIPTAALFYKQDGSYLLKTYIEKSRLRPLEWLKEYFDHLVLPLYHLQRKYGVGLVAHGQNTILILENYIPKGSMIKDFHGDLRITASSPLNCEEFIDHFEVLPPEYLIHDLITGHFITVLRFMSRSLLESLGVSEENFYDCLQSSVKNYMKTHGQEYPFIDALNLLRPNFERLLVNKVRFVMGYGDTDQRPRALVGSKIRNPLSLVAKAE